MEWSCCRPAYKEGRTGSLAAFIHARVTKGQGIAY